MLCGSCVADILVRPVPLGRRHRLRPAAPRRADRGHHRRNRLQLGHRHVAARHEDGRLQLRRPRRFRRRHPAAARKRGHGLQPAVDASDGRHQHHGRADRPEQRAEFRPLRRRAEAHRQIAAAGQSRRVRPQPHDADRLLLADAEPRSRLARSAGRDSARPAAARRWTRPATAARCSRSTASCRTSTSTSPATTRRPIRPARPTRGRSSTSIAVAARRACWA